MPADERSADEILACPTPDALFGEAAADPRALKRAYARLVRQHRPDESPAVFAHVHHLYTWAQQRLEAAQDEVDDAPADPGDAPEAPPRPAQPTDLLEAWLLDADRALRADVVAALLDLRRRVAFRAHDADPAVLDAVLERLDRADVDAPPEPLSHALRAVALRQAWHRAHADERVPRALLDGLARATHQPPARAAETWLATADALATEDLDTVAGHLELHHPGLAALCHDLERRISGVADPEVLPPDPTRPSLEDLSSGKLARTLRLGQVTDLPTWQRVGIYVVAFSLTRRVLTLLLPGDALWRLVLVAVATVVAWQVLQLARRLRLRASEPDRSRLPTLAFVREHVLFPAELQHAAAAASPPPADPVERRTFAATDPVRALALDPLALLRMLTPAHVDRVRARVAAEEAV